MKLVSVSQMRDLERQADAQGLSYETMMANAGLGLAEIIHRRFYRRPATTILGLVGSGNNGGDTLIALNHLAQWGWQANAYLVKDSEKNDPLVQAFLKSGGQVFFYPDDQNFLILKKQVSAADLLLDGVLGTGIKLPLRGDIQKTLKAISSLKYLPPVVAVDCPSGVDCNSGKASTESLPACLTVCMAAVKQGLLKQPALSLIGEIITIDIGLPNNLPAWQGATTEVMDAVKTANSLPVRPNNAHKGTFGTCLITAGSINYCGAVLLAAEAAYRVGVGLVHAAIPGSIYDTLAGRLPEVTWLILPHTLGVLNGEGAKIVQDNLKNVSAMLIGPGWGLENETFEFLKNLIEIRYPSSKKAPFRFEGDQSQAANEIRNLLPPLVIDADGLKLLARIKNWEKKIGKQSVLTPHPGEMAILTGLSIKEIQANREKIACDYARRWGHIVVLKGALTVVAEPSGGCTLIPIATSALATAGTGDVLAGMIMGLLAQGLEPYSAATTGAWLHAKAGLEAANQLGNPAAVIASDVINAITSVLTQIGGIH